MTHSLHEIKIKHICRIQTDSIDIKRIDPETNHIIKILHYRRITLIQLHQKIVATPVLIGKAIVILIIATKIHITEPITVLGSFTVLLQILKGKKASSDMIKHTVHNDSYSHIMTIVNKIPEILIKKRRVAVAGVMAMRPRILALDEPAAGLDPEGRDDILSEVKEYHKKTGTTVLLVSHSMEDIAKYANRVLVMSNKKIAMYDTVEKVFARAPELLGLGLSVPQVTKIFLKLREMGVDVPADVYTIPYAVKMILEAKRRRDAGETLVLPRADKQEGGADKC